MMHSSKYIGQYLTFLLISKLLELYFKRRNKEELRKNSTMTSISLPNASLNMGEGLLADLDSLNIITKIKSHLFSGFRENTVKRLPRGIPKRWSTLAITVLSQRHIDYLSRCYIGTCVVLTRDNT